MIEPAYLEPTRHSYDTVAADYARLLKDELAASPFERAMLGAFAEHVDGPVADLGCGTGRITGHLAALGLDVFGVDLSPGMIAVARRSLPGLRFEVGSILDLDLPDGGLAGVVAWYSIIHTPPELLPRVFAEFHRVLAPGGHLALAFQVGEEVVHLREGYGHPVVLDAYRLSPSHIEEHLAAAGFVMTARMRREAARWEPTPQVYLFARRPADVP
ncbi:MAG TPA: class I SAM-dependent methyltransferase [Amycolatopsis sp.]|nr:class I SAM-dependent methyltransferase [Amycolatopsis sp.]